jgi:hypothetical protein
MGNRGTWRGRITQGRLRGYEVEVRVSGEPIPIYVIAYRAPDASDPAPMDFAVGDEALRSHFLELEGRVEWRAVSPSRQPVVDRSMGVRTSGRSTFVRRLIHLPRKTGARLASRRCGGAGEQG